LTTELRCLPAHEKARYSGEAGGRPTRLPEVSVNP
jgi:hypothetical protein